MVCYIYLILQISNKQACTAKNTRTFQICVAVDCNAMITMIIKENTIAAHWEELLLIIGHFDQRC